MPTINLADDELAAVAAALRRLVEESIAFPLRHCLIRCARRGKLEAATEPTPPPKTPTRSRATRLG